MRVSNVVRAIVWVLMLAVLLALGPLVDTLYGLSCTQLYCRITGVIVLLAVLRAAGVTGRYLAVYGKSDPRKGFGEIDRLVDVGPYSCMRHPMHFFLSFFPLSIALLYASPSAIILSLVEMILILLLAVVVDEKESIERFGEKYIEYRRRVPAFNLNPKCLYMALAHRPPRPKTNP